LKYARVHALNLLLKFAQTQNLQQLCIEGFLTAVSNEFMMSVSAHCGLVHVVMMIQSLTVFIQSLTLFSILLEWSGKLSCDAGLFKLYLASQQLSSGFQFCVS